MSLTVQDSEISVPNRCPRPVVLALAIALFPALMLIPAVTGYSQELSGKVVDENGEIVAGAKVSLSGGSLKAPLVAVSDDGGRILFPSVAPAIYELRAEKPGYYATIERSFEVKGNPAPVEITLNHQQEYEEKVDVVYSAPVIDRQDASAATSLTAEEIIDLPTIATHDFRNSLPLIPGVVKDNLGRLHLNGGADNQTYYSLDGFNITSPASGVMENRISVDAIRGVEVQTSRYSAEYGKGSAGVMALESSRGDDRFRFSSTNFIPSIEFQNGLKISNWNPRATVSGPIDRGRAWFYDALDLQYDLNTVKELPAGADTNSDWLGSNLTRIQVNLTGTNILTGGFLFNLRNTAHAGLSPLDPVETTRALHDRSYFVNLRDQAYIASGWVVESGLAMNQLNSRSDPLGTSLYVISPEGRSGNYYMRSDGRVDRTQALANVLPRAWNWHGRHILKFGVDADRISYRQISDRSPFEVKDNTGAVTREVSFQGNPAFDSKNTELSGYVQDSWTLNDRLFIETGIRFDWDQILRQPLWSPRLAFTWVPTPLPDSKFSAGVGVFYDATNLRLLTQALDQERLDTFYDTSGAPLAGSPITSRFVADASNLKEPFYLNWSLGWQQKLSHGFYLETNFIRKNGRHNWAYNLVPPSPATPSTYVYQLRDTRRDSYSYVEVGVSRTFKGKYPWLLSYARSGAHTTEVLDFSQDNTIFAPQAGGPLDWDTPNRLISWAVIPVPHFKKYTLAYFAEWHSGVPWSAVDQFQRLVGDPNSRRFPDYVSLNLHLERRFHLWRWEWALRAGFNNITGHQNPTVVSNVTSASDFGEFSGSEGRVFTGRIRFLGKN